MANAPILRASDESFPPGPRTVLVVEGDDLLRGLIQRALEGDGYNVQSAASIIEARRQLKEIRVDLVATDVNFPDGDGVDMVMHLRESAPQVPVIVIAMGYHGLDHVVYRILRHFGARQILEKPFSLQLLLDAVRDTIRPTGSATTRPAVPSGSSQPQSSAPGGVPA